MGFAWFQVWISAWPQASDKTGSPTSKSVMDGLACGMDEGLLLEMTAVEVSWSPLLGDFSDHLWLLMMTTLDQNNVYMKGPFDDWNYYFFLELAIEWWFDNCLTIQQLGNTELTRVRTSDWIRSNWMVWELISLSFFKLFNLITILNWLMVGWFYNYVSKLFEEIEYMDLVEKTNITLLNWWLFTNHAMGCCCLTKLFYWTAEWFKKFFLSISWLNWSSLKLFNQTHWI